MATVDSLLQELSPEAGQVQKVTEEWVCNTCLGPVRGTFATCYACGQLSKAGVPAQLTNAVVPASIAVNPGRWYRRLATYKAGNPPYRAHLAALAWAYIDRHEDKLAHLAGGELTTVTPVPSKKGRSYDDQPLQQALSVVEPIKGRLANTLEFVPAPDVNYRRNYYPDCFDSGPDSVTGERVLLVEDSWVTGATALSAAGALLDRGAEGVAILTLARVFDTAYWADSEHPYLPRLLGNEREDFNIDSWPRRS